MKKTLSLSIIILLILLLVSCAQRQIKDEDIKGKVWMGSDDTYNYIAIFDSGIAAIVINDIKTGDKQQYNGTYEIKSPSINVSINDPVWVYVNMVAFESSDEEMYIDLVQFSNVTKKPVKLYDCTNYLN